MQNKTATDQLNRPSPNLPSPTERTTAFSKKIYEALHHQPEDLSKMLEMLRTLESLIDTLRITDLDKMLLRQKISTLMAIAAVGGPIEYFNAIRAQILECIGS